MQKVLEPILNLYKPISLEDMDSVTLMDRMDTKYYFHVSMLPEILHETSDGYFILEIKNNRQFHYETTYFDTSDFSLYNCHLNEHLNRYKIRQRRYDITGIEFFEIKFKNNKGFTIKRRIQNNTSEPLNKDTAEFLKRNSPCCAEELNPVLKNDFTRITLVDYQKSSRITLDYNISFKLNDKSIRFPNLGVAEVKQNNGLNNSSFISLMRRLGKRPDGISKYCLGAAALYNNLKINTIKSKLIQINKIENDVIDFARQY